LTASRRSSLRGTQDTGIHEKAAGAKLTVIRPANQLLARYTSLQKKCRDAVHQGQLARAEDLARRGLIVASFTDDITVRHQATTNHSMVLLETGRVDEAERGLREVVLASTEDETICRAAFYLASSLRRQKRMSRAVSFARTASERAASLADPLWSARCHNLTGNIELNRGGLDLALGHYRRALAIWETAPGDHRFALAIVLDNLGYCLTLQKKVWEGLPYLARALAYARETGDKRTEAECRQDLAHSLMSLGAVAASRDNARTALAIGEDQAYRDIVQNCFYILGELAAMEEDDQERDYWFTQLQTLYPDVPHLREFLGMFDVSDLLTFH
jgi:tetratricopeptide (TPR) repeat protein